MLSSEAPDVQLCCVLKSTDDAFTSTIPHQDSEYVNEDDDCWMALANAELDEQPTNKLAAEKPVEQQQHSVTTSAATPDPRQAPNNAFDDPEHGPAKVQKTAPRLVKRIERRARRGGFFESQEWHRRILPLLAVANLKNGCGGWMASTDPLSEFPLFAVAQYEYHAVLDVAPSNRIPDLSLFKNEEIDVLYNGLLVQIDQLDRAYAGLLSHLNTVSERSTETSSLLRQCFFLQHNLAGQFEMLGMYGCARHSQMVESKLALFPPIHEQYPLHELSEDAIEQRECLWASPLLLLQLIQTYQLHMRSTSLPLPVLNAS